MSKKSQQLYPHQKPLLYKKKEKEFRNCDAPSCQNIVSVVNLPRQFSGPVYCILHRNEHG